MEKISLDGRVVCVVDDDDIYRQYLLAMLTQKKLNVVEASGSDELIELLGRRSVDCIVLDYSLGSESGLAVNDELRGRFRKPPPVVMLTANEGQRTIIKAFRNGVSDYVLKRELRPDELLNAIQNAIERRQKEDAREEDLSRLRRHAMMDEVTGLHSRASVEERLERAAKGASRRQGQFGIVMLALNELGTVESQFGYVVRDRVLRAAASRLQLQARETDLCGRYGDDSFICLVDVDIDPPSLDRLAERLAESLSFELNLDVMSCRFSASVAAALYPADGTDAESVIRAAEQALAVVRAQNAPPARLGDMSRQPSDPVDDAATAQDYGTIERQGDRRRERRHRTLKRGQIVIKELHSVVDCTIRDMSAEGARLRVESHFFAPELFDLLILGSGKLRRVRVRWQNGRELGVQFTG